MHNYGYHLPVFLISGTAPCAGSGDVIREILVWRLFLQVDFFYDSADYWDGEQEICGGIENANLLDDTFASKFTSALVSEYPVVTDHVLLS